MSAESIYLNTFRASTVLRIFDQLMAADKELIFAERLSGVTREEAEEDPFLILSYDPLLHRIFLNVLDPQEPLFTNPQCVCKLVPEEMFIGMVKPSAEFRMIMKAQ